MFGRERLIPFQLVVLIDFVLVVAHFATQRLVRSRAAFHKPSTQTLMMNARNVAGTVAGLDQGLVTFTVVTNPAFSFIQESFVVFSTFACKFTFSVSAKRRKSGRSQTCCDWHSIDLGQFSFRAFLLVKFGQKLPWI